MLQQLINHNSDVNRLYDEGYQLEVIGGHLLVHQIPYVNANTEIKNGTFVCILTYASPSRLAPPQDHTIFFCGEKPCDKNGIVLDAIINNSNSQQLTNSILVNHYFSSKPKSGNYANYYDKIRTYAEILSSQAMAIDNSVTAKPNKKK
jgi:hypothetical protein